jgi:hypothetical protein
LPVFLLKKSAEFLYFVEGVAGCALRIQNLAALTKIVGQVIGRGSELLVVQLRSALNHCLQDLSPLDLSEAGTLCDFS